MSAHGNGPFENKRGLLVEVRNSNIEGAIRMLTRKVKQEGLLRELRNRQYFEKPSIVRRKKKAESLARWKKNRARQTD